MKKPILIILAIAFAILAGSYCLDPNRAATQTMNALVSASQGPSVWQFFDNAICISPHGDVVFGSSDGCKFLPPSAMSAKKQFGVSPSEFQPKEPPILRVAQQSLIESYESYFVFRFLLLFFGGKGRAFRIFALSFSCK